MGMPRGGFNPNQMLKQLQKMQREMEDTQAQLAEEVVEGTAGGGVVTARVKGDQTVESISIGSLRPLTGKRTRNPSALIRSASAGRHTSFT